MANLKEQAKALYLYGFPLVVTEATHWGAATRHFSICGHFPPTR